MAAVYYPGIAAGDAASITATGEVKAIVTPNALYRVYELDDLAEANPLPILTEAKLPAGPTGHEVPVGALPIFPDVYVVSPNFAHRWVSGELSFRRDSQDAKDKAVADALAAAQLAAANAGAAAEAELAARVAAGEFKGEPGKDGANVVPTAQAIATEIQTPGTPANTALSATVASSITDGTANPGGYDVILLAGQSNMSGRGVGHTNATDPVHPMIFQIKGKTPDKGTIIPAAEPLDMVDFPSGIGPGMQFARWYVSEGLNRGRKVLLVPTAQGGTPLTRVATPTWKPSVDGSLFNNAINQTNVAMALPGSKLVAILWLQGETDGDLAATGSAYQADFDALITGFRSTITGATNTPFVLGQMVPDYLPSGTRTEINAVHADTPNRLAYTGFAPSPAGPAYHLGDGNHFNAVGQRAIGKSMFDVFQKIKVGLSSSVAATATPLTLGVTTAPVMAYSLRRINSIYTGPAITVRRTNGTSLDIGFTAAGDLDTAALLTFAGAGDAWVSKWFDQSGNGRHVSQATAAAQPKIVAAGVLITSGSFPAVQFDGVDDHLFNTTPALWAAGKATVAAVINAAAPTAQSRWWAESLSTSSGEQYGLMQSDSPTAGQQAYPVISGSISAGTMTPQSTLPFFNGAIHQGTSVDTGTAISQWVDGVLDLSSAAYTRLASTKDRFAIGGVVRSGSLAPKAAKVSELVLWPSAFGTSVRQTIEASQKAYYGTP